MLKPSEAALALLGDSETDVEDEEALDEGEEIGEDREYDGLVTGVRPVFVPSEPTPVPTMLAGWNERWTPRAPVILPTMRTLWWSTKPSRHGARSRRRPPGVSSRRTPKVQGF